MGHPAPKTTSHTALDRVREAYAHERISLAEMEARIEYLVFNGLEDATQPMWYERPAKPCDSDPFRRFADEVRSRPTSVHLIASPYDGVMPDRGPHD